MDSSFPVSLSGAAASADPSSSPFLRLDSQRGIAPGNSARPRDPLVGGDLLRNWFRPAFVRLEHSPVELAFFDSSAAFVLPPCLGISDPTEDSPHWLRPVTDLSPRELADWSEIASSVALDWLDDL